MNAHLTRICGLAVIVALILLPLAGGFGGAEQVEFEETAEEPVEMVEEQVEEHIDFVEDLETMDEMNEEFAMVDELRGELLVRDRLWSIFGALRGSAEQIKEEVPDLTQENVTEARANMRENVSYVVEYIVTTSQNEKIDDAQAFRDMFHNGTRNFIDGVQEEREGPGDLLLSQKGRFRERLFEAKEKGAAELIGEASDMFLDALSTANNLSAEDMGTGENIEETNEFTSSLYEALGLSGLVMWADSMGDAMDN